MEVKLAVHYKQERINPEDNNNGLLWGIYYYDIPKIDIDTDNMYNNDIVWDNMYQEIDTYLIYYSDQLEVMEELRLYDWSHLDNCTNIGQVAYRGLEEEIMSRGKVTNIDNYKFNYEKQEQTK